MSPLERTFAPEGDSRDAARSGWKRAVARAR
jgi:hypothetical protein